MKPHKYAEIIKAWADGARVELWDGKAWCEITCPIWSEMYQFRIKPEDVKHDQN